jgi:hypothetical protein
MARKEPPAVALLDLGLPPDAEGVSEGFATLGFGDCSGIIQPAPGIA